MNELRVGTVREIKGALKLLVIEIDTGELVEKLPTSALRVLRETAYGNCNHLSYLSQSELDELRSQGERKVYEACRDLLDSNWTVVHSVAILRLPTAAAPKMAQCISFYSILT